MAKKPKIRHRSRKKDFGCSEQMDASDANSVLGMKSSGSEPGDYEVGYKKPPKSGQFPKGQSGNPKGRKKGSRNLVTLLERELKSEITVREGGKRRTLTKGGVIILQLYKKAVEGHLPSIKLLLQYDEGLAAARNKQQVSNDDLAEDRSEWQTDEEILEAFIQQRLGAGETSDTAASSNRGESDDIEGVPS